MPRTHEGGTVDENDAVEALRLILGFEDEPDPSTAALMYAAVDGDFEAAADLRMQMLKRLESSFVPRWDL